MRTSDFRIVAIWILECGVENLGNELNELKHRSGFAESGCLLIVESFFLCAVLTRMSLMLKQFRRCWDFRVIGMLHMQMSLHIFVNTAIPVKFGKSIFDCIMCFTDVYMNFGAEINCYFK